MMHAAPAAVQTPMTEEALLDRLFREARSFNTWTARPVTAEMLRRLYDIVKWGPTAANSTPARFVFLCSMAAKERLKPHLSPGNVDKVISAPCTVIIAYDSRFYELLPKLFPSRDMQSAFVGKETVITETALRSSTLQGAYLIMAARALGLDCGPMSGFKSAATDTEFFPDGRWRSNFLCTLGYGKREDLFPRNPRLEFDEACLEL
jgi:3-hydroxypropanoate dehydrogenase